MPKTLSYETIEKLNGLFCILKIAAQNFPNNIVVYFKPKEEKYTYRKLHYYALKFASALKNLGIKKRNANCFKFE
ncbi:MAG: hypothetical protein ACTSWR_00500 [Candidatus Helarchaeota archaeon]